MTSAAGLKSFYNGKTIFITGGTGFLGICLLEKILRCIPDYGEIYLLLRPKKGKEIAERLEEIKKNAIFETLLKDQTVEKVFAKIHAVAGDVGQENLGLSSEDRKLLTQKVDVIFHSAATLDFGDSLKTTVDINLLGTRRITELARQCSNLKVLVHVSSAYVNSYRLKAEEIIYPLPKDPEEVIALVAKLTPEELEQQTPEILGDHPNTYTITKHMAEHEVQKIESAVPCAIVRPSMIIGAWKEPVAGWTISKNGPQGFMMGASKGVIRRLPVATELIYDYIPIDMVVNTLLAAGFHAGITNTKKVEIYHCTSSTRNPFKWDLVKNEINSYLHTYPLKSAVWYPNLKLIPSITLYKISAFFVHIIPALLLDTVTRLAGGRPILMKLHRNVNSSLDRLSKFIFTEWHFSANKTAELQSWLNQTDQQEFNLDISSLIWKDYFIDLVLGARIYLSRDPAKTLNSAKKKDTILLGLHILWKVGVITLIWWLFSLVTGILDAYRPELGSYSEQRALKAKIRVFNEILDLCRIVDKFGTDHADGKGKKIIKFGELFELYSRISNKIMGVLSAARKNGYLEYEGETLFQGPDNNGTITLSTSMKNTRKEVTQKIEQCKEELQRSLKAYGQTYNNRLQKLYLDLV